MARQIRNPVTGWWEKVPEPRWTSMAWATAYGVLAAAGASVLLDTPSFLLYGLGGALTVYWAMLLVAGGVIGMFAAPTGWYIIERFAVLAVGVAVAMYTTAVVSLYLAVGTNVIYQVLIDGALVIVVAGRWVQVRWGVRDPERYSTYTPHAD